MARKSLLYWIFNKLKRPLYQDDNLHIQEGDPGSYAKPDGQPAHLQKSPQGWSDTLVKYARNLTYLGLFRDFTAPMKLVGDGARILGDQMWRFGTEALVYLAIMRFDRQNLPYKYENMYLSELNFLKFQQTETGVTIEALEGGLVKQLKAGENVVQQLTLEDDPEYINVINDGAGFDWSRTFTLTPGQDATDVDTYFTGLNETAREGASSAFDFSDLIRTSGTPYPNDNWVGRPTRLFTVELELTCRILYNQNITAIIRAEVNDGLTSGGTTQYNLVNQAGTAGQAQDFHTILSFDVPANYRLHIKDTMFNPLATGLHYTIVSGELVIRYVYRHPTSYTRCLYPFRALDKLTQAISEGQSTAISDWLQAKKDIAITCGDALRKIPGAKLKLTVMQLFGALKTLPRDGQGGGAALTVDYGVGLAQQLRIERLKYFFKSDLTVDLGEVSAAELDVAEDLMFNTIRAGQEPNDYNDVAGKFEFNQSATFTAPVTRVLRELTLISAIRRDMLGIELARINYEDRKTVDDQADPDPFMMNIKTVAVALHVDVTFEASSNTMVAPRELNFAVGEQINITGTASNNGLQQVVALVDLGYGWQVQLSGAVVDEATVTAILNFVDHPYFELYRPAYAAITGIPHPELAFNTELTAMHAVLSNGDYIRACLDLQDAGSITFKTADKNQDLSTTLGALTVTENDSPLVGNLAAPLFRPYYLKFTTKVPVNVLALIRSNPYGRVRFTVKGIQFEGFLWDGGFKPATQDAQQWTLLSAPENDLSKYNVT